MSNPGYPTLHEKLRNLDRQENFDLINKIFSSNRRLAQLIGEIGGSLSAQDKAQAEINEISNRIATLCIVVDAIDDEFKSFQCGLNGLIEMLSHMTESEINAGSVLCLLMPLSRQFREANTEFDSMVAV
ncbi:DUF1484 family protein [Sulfuritalea sp.]|uniref:DUF1484 family protein n=1 Tax=Sulfuritalea sp. TaxID=2480090 RepID=UPI001ACBB6BF|nr:DUF1484 family protein [Sulfuritalea sp.]MBN8476441.1 DUF1484 family protein [Sulfuritalea sp.]